VTTVIEKRPGLRPVVRVIAPGNPEAAPSGRLKDVKRALNKKEKGPQDQETKIAVLIELGREHGPFYLGREIVEHEKKIALLKEAMRRLEAE
jgi:hypothetical protein